jgi:hypothetical protein
MDIFYAIQSVFFIFVAGILSIFYLFILPLVATGIIELSALSIAFAAFSCFSGMDIDC